MAVETEVTHVAEPATTDPRLAILEAFCASDDCRDYLNKPFAVDGVAAATNGHIIIFMDGLDVPRVDGLPEGMRRHLDVARMAAQGADFIDAASISVPDGPTCAACRGVGRLTSIECSDCDGEGEGEFWHGSHIYDCKSCDGGGAVTVASSDPTHGALCGRCFGSGYQAAPVPLDGMPDPFGINSIYLRKVQATLPGAQLKALTNPGLHELIIAIRFDGGYGFVMPMRC